MKRVVVTGMGAVTPIGNSVEEFWDNIKKNTVGIGEITKFDVSDYKCKLAAEVKNFDPKQYMDPKAARRMEPFCQYAIAATGEAIKDAGLDLEKEDRTRIGTCIGNGLGGVATIEKEHKKVVEGIGVELPSEAVELKYTDICQIGEDIRIKCQVCDKKQEESCLQES